METKMLSIALYEAICEYLSASKLTMMMQTFGIGRFITEKSPVSEQALEVIRLMKQKPNGLQALKNALVREVPVLQRSFDQCLLDEVNYDLLKVLRIMLPAQLHEIALYLGCIDQISFSSPSLIQAGQIYDFAERNDMEKLSEAIKRVLPKC